MVVSKVENNPFSRELILDSLITYPREQIIQAIQLGLRNKNGMYNELFDRIGELPIPLLDETIKVSGECEVPVRIVLRHLVVHQMNEVGYLQRELENGGLEIYLMYLERHPIEHHLGLKDGYMAIQP